MIRCVGVTGLVSIARKEDQVHLVLQGIVHYLTETPQKVHDTVVEPRSRVQMAIVFHADVQVGQMQQANVIHGIQYRLYVLGSSAPVALEAPLQVMTL